VFSNTVLARIEIRCGLENFRSQRVAEKSGATPAGVRAASINLHGKLVDAYIYQIKRQ